jgi:DNA-binding response OmpR family regulator
MGEKPLILLVDDEPDIVQLVALRLDGAGYEVVAAYNGQQALEYVRQVRPDLIILDLMLPRVDGYRVARLLKFNERYKEIPILILTARALEEEIQLAMDCGADAYLTKPFDAQMLLTRVRELLDSVKVTR